MNMLRILYYIIKVKRADILSREKIVKLQKKRFKKLLAHVLEHSKFYREYYKKHGVDIENIDNIKLQDLPTINKEIVMDNFDDVVCTPDLKRKDIENFIADPKFRGKKYKGQYHIIHTSGSSGKIGIFVYGKKEWPLLIALALLRVTKNKFKIFRKPRILFIGATDGHYAGISLAESAPRAIFDFMPVSINQPISEINKAIDKFQPDSITGYASGAYILAQQQLKGNINLKPERIVCSGDTLTPAIKEKVEEAFGIVPVNFYASSESIGMAGDCENQELHIFDDWHLIELVDENNKLVERGKPGHVLMTNLYNFTEPLIRYEMQDELILDEKDCSCGWHFPAIKCFAGRDQEFLWFKKDNGEDEFIHPAVLIEFFVEGLSKFQFIQVKRNKLLMRVVIKGDNEKVVPAIKDRMREILSEKQLEDTVNFIVEVVEDIKIDPKTGKFKLIFPL